MSKLVNLITGLIGFGLFAVFIIGLPHVPWLAQHPSLTALSHKGRRRPP